MTTPPIETKKLSFLLPTTPSSDPTPLTTQKINDLAAETISKSSASRFVKFPKKATLGFIAKTAFLTITLPTLIAAGAAGVYFFAPITIPLYAIIGTSVGTGALLYTGGEVVLLAKLIKNSGVLKQKKEPTFDEKPTPLNSSNETTPQIPVQNSSASPSNPIEVETNPTAPSSDPQPELSQLISNSSPDTQNTEEKKPSEETVVNESPSSLSSNSSCSRENATEDSSTVSNFNTSQETTQKPVEQSVQNSENAAENVENHDTEDFAKNHASQDPQNLSNSPSTPNDPDSLIQNTLPDTVSTIPSPYIPEEKTETDNKKNSSLQLNSENEQNDLPEYTPGSSPSIASPDLPLHIHLPQSLEGSEADSSEISDSLDGLFLPSQASSPSLTSVPPTLPPRAKKEKSALPKQTIQPRPFTLSSDINLNITPNVPYVPFGPEKQKAIRRLYSEAVFLLNVPGVKNACELIINKTPPSETPSPQPQPKKTSLKKMLNVVSSPVKSGVLKAINKLYKFAMGNLDGTNILDQLIFISQDPKTRENYDKLLYCDIPLAQTLVKNKTYEAYHGRTQDNDFSQKLDQLIAVNPNAVTLRDSAETITPDNFLNTLFPPNEAPSPASKHPQKSLPSPKSKKK